MGSWTELSRKISSHTARVAVVGQGYVGLSLACAVAEAGFEVQGIDVDADRVRDLATGRLTVPGVREDEYTSAQASGRIAFTTTFDAVDTASVICICLPTPAAHGAPDLAVVERGCKEVARHLQPGTLVVLESTTYAGSTEEVVRPILETSGLEAGVDFHLAYSPERIDPGNEQYGFREIPRIVGGLTTPCAELATSFYEQLVDEVVTVSSSRAAEMAKLLENTYRHVNIALVNELAMLCHEFDVDVWEVIRAAASKPFGFTAFQPGPGVGGHCIPVDPLYLAWQVRRDAGRRFSILEQAQEVNAGMPAYVARRIGEALNSHGKALQGADVLVLGVTYKPDVADTRESPALEVMRHLRRSRAAVSFADPYVDEVGLGSDMLSAVQLTPDAMRRADCVAVLTPHTAFDLDSVARHSALVFDARHAMGDAATGTVVRL